MNGLTDTREIRVKTPFGDPSDAIVIGTLEGKRVAFLARHGRGHRLLPSELNFRGNIYAMKLLGVERVISVSAVGSLREELRPGEFLVPDQFFRQHQGPRLHLLRKWAGGGMSRLTSPRARNCPRCSPMLAFLLA